MSLNEGSSGSPLPEGIAGDIEFIRRCLNVLDVELTRKIAGKKPAMSGTALLCPVLNAKEALDRLEAKIGGDKKPKRNMEKLSEIIERIRKSGNVNCKGDEDWTSEDVGRMLIAIADELESIQDSLCSPDIRTDKDDQPSETKALQDIASLESWLGDFKEPVDGDSSAIYENAKWDGTKFCGREIPTWWGASWRKALITAVFIARRALDSKEGQAAGGANTNEEEKTK